MGTFGSGVFENDAALDFLDQIDDMLVKEITYWSAPAQLKELDRRSASFLFAPIDLLASILEHYDHPLIVNQPMIQPYKDSFLAAWKQAVPDSTEREYLIIAALFDRLRVLEYGYDGAPNEEEREQHQATVLPDTTVQGSVKELLDLKDPEWGRGSFYLLSRITAQLRREIIYWFSLEMRERLSYELGDVLIPAADMLAFICDYYHQSPELSARKIRHWQKVLLRLWDKAVASPGGVGKADYEVGRRKVIVETFDKLEAVAQKYPPIWGEDE